MSEKQNPSELIRLRPATETDVPFIFNSWLKNYRHSINTRGCENPVYFAQHHKVLEGLCKRAEIWIACNPEDISQIYGYVAAEKIENLVVLHMTYVKETYRKLGIGKTLLKQVGVDYTQPMLYTHKTVMCDELHKNLVMVYNPYLAYYGYELGKNAQ